ncbi:MAG: hypothetical protein ACTSW7_01490 [Candidatus Thorarchaeota archaeon]|nr:hypothetical protein [Thermoplasmatales archaeon]
MGLNPSNNVKKGFPTLGDPPFPTECKDKAVKELIAAGFPRGSWSLTTEEIEIYEPGSEADQLARSGIHIPSIAKESPTIWTSVHKVIAELYGWKFSRAWYYWRASAKYKEHFIPEVIAHEFNETFFTEARVEGFAGGKKVSGPVDSYHIDTPNGFKALIELLKQQDEILKEEQIKKWKREGL